MLSIGEISRRTDVKVPTIRYYEQIGLMPDPGRTDGNQRRYGDDAVERLNFIRHSRDLGFSVDAIRELIELGEHPGRPCERADTIAATQLREVRARIARLQSLERELERMLAACSGRHDIGDCRVYAALADHALCAEDH